MAELNLRWQLADGPHEAHLTDAAPAVIGRLTESDVTLTSERVSRRHALVQRRGDAFVVSDLTEGRNPVVLNGSRVTGETLLRAGDLLMLGDVTLTVVNVVGFVPSASLQDDMDFAPTILPFPAPPPSQSHTMSPPIQPYSHPYSLPQPQPIYINASPSVHNYVAVAPVAVGNPYPTSSAAVTSLLCGLAAWFILPFIGAVIAVIAGHAALTEIRGSRGRIRGEGMAVTGLVLGYLQLAGIVFFLLLIFGALSSHSR